MRPDVLFGGVVGMRARQRVNASGGRRFGRSVGGGG